MATKFRIASGLEVGRCFRARWRFLLISALTIATVNRVLVAVTFSVAYTPFFWVPEMVMGVAFTGVAATVCFMWPQSGREANVVRVSEMAGALVVTVLWLGYDFTFDPGWSPCVGTAVLAFSATVWCLRVRTHSKVSSN